MDVNQLERLIETLRESNADSREMARRIQESLYEDIGYAKVDHARAAHCFLRAAAMNDAAPSPVEKLAMEPPVSATAYTNPAPRALATSGRQRVAR